MAVWEVLRIWLSTWTTWYWPNLSSIIILKFLSLFKGLQLPGKDKADKLRLLLVNFSLVQLCILPRPNPQQPAVPVFLEGLAGSRVAIRTLSFKYQGSGLWSPTAASGNGGADTERGSQQHFSPPLFHAPPPQAPFRGLKETMDLLFPSFFPFVPFGSKILKD